MKLFDFFIATALAAENSTDEISNSVYLQAFFSLLFILGILFVAAWVLRKISGSRVFGNQKLKIIGGVSVSPREKIILLQIADKCLVVGVVPGQIRTLHQLPISKIYSEAELAEINKESENSTNNEILNLFQNMLQKKIKEKE